MADQWLHLSETGGDPWVLRIWTSLHKANQDGRFLPITPEMGEMALHVSTRLNLLPYLINRFNRDLAALEKAAKEHGSEHVFSKEKEGAAFRVDDEIKYCLIADADSFLFEVNACTDLTEQFFGLLHAHADDRIAKNQVRERLRAVLKNDGVPEGWFKKLNKVRNFVAHHGTPYVAVDISRSGRPEAIFLMENLKILDDPNKFFSTSDLQEIADGFRRAKIALQAHLIRLFEQDSNG